MGKITVQDTKGKPRHEPFLKELSAQGGTLRATPRRVKSTKGKQQEEEEFLGASMSRKILQLAQEQQEELKEEEERSTPSFGETFRMQQKKDQEEESESESDDEEYSDYEEEYEEEEVEIDEKDAELFNKYFQSNGPDAGNGGTFNLADKIMAKIQEREHQQQQAASGNKPEDAVLLPPKVIAAYEKIGSILTTYTHGKLPKLFKVLPSLRNWEDVLYVTDPSAWTPHAVYEATKLFVSNLQANQAQKFVEQVLLERFRTSIEESEDHSLNYHLYRSLKKSLYKPAAFFKGFLLPLVDGYCSVREATIAASVLAKVSVPVLHSSVALTQLLQRDFQPSTTVFIRVLIEKKYALPYQTLDELVFYFMRFRNAAQQQKNPDFMEVEEGAGLSSDAAPQLPVVWHKAFLAFAQHYKNDITEDQRDFLMETVRQRFHKGIGPEIRRELLAGKPRLTATKDASMQDAF